MSITADYLAARYDDAELIRPDPSRYSLSVAALSPPCNAMRARYEELLSTVVDLLPQSVQRQDLYLYPTSALHITCATLHGYTRDPPRDPNALTTKSDLETTTLAGTAALRALWTPAVKKATCNIAKFRVAFTGVVVRGSAMFILGEDLDGGVASLRASLSAAVSDIRLQRAICEVGSSPEYFGAPRIVHMTMMRVRKPPLEKEEQVALVEALELAGRRVFSKPLMVDIESVGFRESQTLHAINGKVDANFAVQAS